jgi:Fur family ferric uptake transcriptional regulator
VATSDAARIERTVAAIRKSGDRLTSARLAIVRHLARAGRHLTAEEIASAIRARDPQVSIATVYRTLDRLEEIGLAYHVHLGHGPATWHLDDEAHHHFACQSCGQVLEIPEALVSSIRSQIKESMGCEVDTRHFAMTGLCATCSARQSQCAEPVVGLEPTT